MARSLVEQHTLDSADHLIETLEERDVWKRDDEGEAASGPAGEECHPTCSAIQARPALALYAPIAGSTKPTVASTLRALWSANWRNGNEPFPTSR